MFGLRNLGSFKKSIIERMVFYWGILGLEAFLLIEGYFHYMEGSFPLIEGFGDRVIFTLFEIFYLHPVLGSYCIYRKNCIEIPVLGKSSSAPDRSRNSFRIHPRMGLKFLVKFVV